MSDSLGLKPAQSMRHPQAWVYDIGISWVACEYLEPRGPSRETHAGETRRRLGNFSEDRRSFAARKLRCRLNISELPFYSAAPEPRSFSARKNRE